MNKQLIPVGARVRWSCIEGQGTVITNCGEYITVQWDYDPPNSPTGYHRNVAEKHLVFTEAL